MFCLIRVLRENTANAVAFEETDRLVHHMQFRCCAQLSGGRFFGFYFDTITHKKMLQGVVYGH